VDLAVNEVVARDLQVFDAEVSLEKAETVVGLRTVRGELYPNPVRIVSVGVSVQDLLANPLNEAWRNHSIEFCGGTHLERTSQIGRFSILSEEAISKGVRRIVAVTGDPARKAADNSAEFERKLAGAKPDAVQELLRQLEDLFAPKARKIRFREQISALHNQQHKNSKLELSSLQDSAAAFAAKVIEQLSASGAIFFVGSVDVAGHSNLLTDIIKKINDKFPDTAVLLLSPDTPKKKVVIVARVPPPLLASKALKANEWASDAAAAVGGKGGGRPETAQGTGNDISKIDEAVAKASKFAASKLS